MSAKKVLVGITGASGAIYGQALLVHLARQGACEVSVVISDAGQRVVRSELGVEAGCRLEDFGNWLRVTPEEAARLAWVPVSDIGAAAASGSNPLYAMAVVPCSMRTLAAVANGLADNLLTRAADVCLKEGRRLVLVPREMPLNAIHLENMLRLSRLGVRIVPPSPAFYHGPKTIDDLVRFVVQKTVEQMGLEAENPIRWNEKT